MIDSVHRIPADANVGHETLVARARFLGVNEGKFLSGTPRDRHTFKIQYLRRLRQTARDMQINEEEFVAERMADWPEEIPRDVGEDVNNRHGVASMSYVVDEDEMPSVEGDDDNSAGVVGDDDNSDIEEDDGDIASDLEEDEMSRVVDGDDNNELGSETSRVVDEADDNYIPNSDELLRHQARFLGVDENEYVHADVKTRTLRRAHFVRALRKRARDEGKNEDLFVETEMADFPEGQLTAHQIRQKEYRRKFLEKQKLGLTKKRGQQQGEEPRVPAANQATPNTESRVPAANQATARDVESRVPAAKPATIGPRTLADLYVEYPIAEMQDSYYLRVERTHPKKYQGFDVAGYVGNVRGYMEEREFQMRFGGSEYLVTPYGPDPRRLDANGDPRIRALGASIKIVVPVYPPNLDVAEEERQMQHSSLSPFGARPINQHDAVIHKTNVEFQRDLLTQQREEAARKEREQQVQQGSIFQYIADTQKQSTEVLREAATERQRVLEGQLLAERSERKELENKLNRISETFMARTGQGLDVDNLQKILMTMGPNREAESQRQAENHRIQMDTLKTANEEALKQLRERHLDEIRRNEDRAKDSEQLYRRQLDEERQRFSERERSLRDEIDKIRRDERDLAKQRMDEVKDRFEGEIKQLEKSHEREMRSLRESFDTKLTVTKETNELRIMTAEERARDAKEEAEAARIEARESSDPVRVLERAREQAEAMGFEKKDDAPKTAWDLFATTAGMGLSQALSTIQEWGPEMVKSRQAAAPQLPAPGAPQLRAVPRPVPQGAPSPQRSPQGQPIARRERVQQWARPRAVPVTPDEPLGFVSAEQEVQPEVSVAQQEAPPAEPSQVVRDAPVLPAKFLEFFPQEVIFGFLNQAEIAVNNQTDANFFAEQLSVVYPAEAKVLAESFSAAEIVAALQGVEGAEASPLLRRDGKVWLETLWMALSGQRKRTA